MKNKYDGHVPEPWSVKSVWGYKRPVDCRYSSTLGYYSTHHDDPGFTLYSAPIEGPRPAIYEDEARATINLMADAQKLLQQRDALIAALQSLEVLANTVDYCYRNRPEKFANALIGLASSAEVARNLIASIEEKQK